MPDTTAVSIKNVSKQFDNIEVLRDINLTVEKGSVVSILGSSGSGKSTLLRCMNWLEQPDRGEIHIGGQRLGIDEQNGKARCPTASCRRFVSGWGWCSRVLTCGRT